MEGHIYEGTLEIINKNPLFQKKEPYIISHQNTDSIVRTNIKVRLKKGEKFLSFLGFIPLEYDGEKVILTTFRKKEGTKITYKHKIKHNYFYTLKGELIADFSKADIEEKPISWGPYMAFPAGTHFGGMKKI